VRHIAHLTPAIDIAPTWTPTMISTATPHPIDASLIADASAGSLDVAAWTRATAAARQIALTAEPIDTFVDAATHLADTRVHMDETEQVLLALARHGLISDAQRFALHAAHLRSQTQTGRAPPRS
jgi:hypothetical protein